MGSLPIARRARGAAAIPLAAAVAASIAPAQQAVFRPGPTAAVASASAPYTVDDATANAFGFPSPLLAAAERRAFAVGNSFFKQNWITAPASATGRDGLGPLFNARSCSACHPRDGRSRPPEPGEADRSGLLVRIGERAADQGPDAPHPRYGAQVQDAAIAGVTPEARVVLEHEQLAGRYGDGTPFTLLRPRVALSELAYGPLGPRATLGARTAPHLVGLGLLEAIPAATLQAWADPDDRDGDGVSGRVHWLDVAGTPVPGRFGWKSTQPDVRMQTAAAFANDIGITSHLIPAEQLAPAQAAAIVFAASEGVEIDDHAFERVVFYTRTLAVPAPRGEGAAEVAAGRAAFTRWGCAACHVPECTTGEHAGVPAFSGRRIAPFTDLLLHDLGEGLADGKRDGDADPREWRTPPLWGIGLLPVVNGHSRLLHDGRARDLAEAVLWHGGEAEAARERFRTAPADERAALLAFVRSL